MTSSPSTIRLLERLWCHIDSRRHRQFGLLLILMIVASIAEVVSIGAVLPFLAVLTAPERVFEHAVAQPLIELLRITKPEQLVMPLTVLFGLSAILAGALRILLLWASTKLSFATGADLSIDIYRRTLYQPYATHVSRNSSEVINGIVGKVQIVIYHIISPVVTLTSGVFMLTIILAALILVNPVVAIGAFGGFGLIYIVIIKISRRKLVENGKRIASESTQLIKSLQEGLGGIRDVLIDGNQAIYCGVYRSADLALRHAQCSNQIIGLSPKYLMESLGMVLIAALALFLSEGPDGIGEAIPVLGALALGAQRLLPLLQQFYAGWSSIKGSQKSLQDTIDLLDQRLSINKHKASIQPLIFDNEIMFDKIFFRYNSNLSWVLEDVTLHIPKGSRVGLIGVTGSGKSTLLDILMGLLEPTKGSIKVDGVDITEENCCTWQKHIAHVPQTIFLADTTIEQNIAFGVPVEQINIHRVREAARQAQIDSTIKSWPEGYQTVVGERGVRLSGGQRQRIGIARALYKQADVIVFDEATSALDDETEKAVMSAIQSLTSDLTIFIIAHRLSTLKTCNIIVDLNKGKIRRTGSYNEVISAAK